MLAPRAFLFAGRSMRMLGKRIGLRVGFDRGIGCTGHRDEDVLFMMWGIKDCGCKMWGMKSNLDVNKVRART